MATTVERPTKYSLTCENDNHLPDPALHPEESDRKNDQLFNLLHEERHEENHDDQMIEFEIHIQESVDSVDKMIGESINQHEALENGVKPRSGSEAGIGDLGLVNLTVDETHPKSESFVIEGRAKCEGLPSLMDLDVDFDGSAYDNFGRDFLLDNPGKSEESQITEESAHQNINYTANSASFSGFRPTPTEVSFPPQNGCLQQSSDFNQAQQYERTLALQLKAAELFSTMSSSNAMQTNQSGVLKSCDKTDLAISSQFLVPPPIAHPPVCSQPQFKPLYQQNSSQITSQTCHQNLPGIGSFGFSNTPIHLPPPNVPPPVPYSRCSPQGVNQHVVSDFNFNYKKLDDIFNNNNTKVSNNNCHVCSNNNNITPSIIPPYPPPLPKPHCGSGTNVPHMVTSQPNFPSNCPPFLGSTTCPPPVTGVDLHPLTPPKVTSDPNCLVLPASSGTHNNQHSVVSSNHTSFPDSALGMKRMSDMSNESSPSKRSRSAGDMEVRLLIQSKTAGSIIGKGGSNISRLRNEYPATITIPDCPGPERVLSINGPDGAVSKVLEEVINALDEASQRSGETDIRMLVHQSQAGAIIGKGGAKIKELRELCGGQVKVYSNCCPQSTDRVIQLAGDQQRVVLTALNIIESLKDSSVKGIDNPYSPYNFDEFYAQEYGGWGEGPKGRFPPMGGRGPVPPMSGPGHMGGRGPIGGPGGPMGPSGGMGGGPFGDRLSDRRRGGSGSGGGGGGSMFGSPRGGLPMRDEYDDMMGPSMGGGKNFLNGNDLMSQNGESLTTSTQVTIPKDAAGAIIGKGGARIRKIRADSCCSITIEDARPGSNDRIITITGTDQQIKHAQYLLQQSVREFGGPPTGRRSNY